MPRRSTWPGWRVPRSVLGRTAVGTLLGRTWRRPLTLNRGRRMGRRAGQRDAAAALTGGGIQLSFVIVAGSPSPCSCSAGVSSRPPFHAHVRKETAASALKRPAFSHHVCEETGLGRESRPSAVMPAELVEREDRPFDKLPAHESLQVLARIRDGVDRPARLGALLGADQGPDETIRSPFLPRSSPSRRGWWCSAGPRSRRTRPGRPAADARCAGRVRPCRAGP